jgi:HSP20 family molecular chaperone IbpA
MLAPFYGFRGLWDDELPAFSNQFFGPRYEVRESENSIMIELEVPRYRQEDLNIVTDVDRGIVTVEGSRRNANQPQQPEGDQFNQLLVATEPLSGFKRSFRLAPGAYDISQMRSNLQHGVLRLVVPKCPPPPKSQPVVLFGNPQGAEHTTRDQMAAIRRDREIMNIKKNESGDELTYEVQLSKNVDRDHVELHLNGRMLEVCVRYVYRTSHSEDSMMYTNSFVLPAGTRREDIHTNFEPGKLVITLKKPASGQQGRDVEVQQGPSQGQQAQSGAQSA